MRNFRERVKRLEQHFARRAAEPTQYRVTVSVVGEPALVRQNGAPVIIISLEDFEHARS